MERSLNEELYSIKAEIEHLTLQLEVRTSVYLKKVFLPLYV